MRQISFIFFTLLLGGIASAQSLESLKAPVNHHIEKLSKCNSDQERAKLGDGLMESMKHLMSHKDALKTNLELPLTTVHSPDGKVKIHTWNISFDDGTHRYHGLITSKGRKNNVVLELRDSTSVLEEVESQEHYPGKWYGALYYELMQVKKGGKTYYTLLGWKAHSNTENRKVIEVLHFSGKRPRLGAPLFENSPHSRKKAFRRVFRYAYDARMNLAFTPDESQIVMDHLSPSRPDLTEQYAFYGPDLSYDSYTWDGRVWYLEKDVDVKGNLNDSKLWTKPEKPDIRN